MAISEPDFEAAGRRGAELREAGHAVSAEYDTAQERLAVGLSTGVILLVPVHLLEPLAGAETEALAEIEIAPSGLDLHWPRLDADVYVPALMQGVFGSRRWMAARENGRKGGRPRKTSTS